MIVSYDTIMVGVERMRCFFVFPFREKLIDQLTGGPNLLCELPKSPHDVSGALIQNVNKIQQSKLVSNSNTTCVLGG